MRALIKRLFDRNEWKTTDFELEFGGNDLAPNVLIFTEHLNATYFISFDIPLRALHSRGDVNVAVVSQKHVELHGKGCWEKWAKAFQPDLVIMTRYGHVSGKQVLNYFRRQGIPTVYHIDDYLLEIPDALGNEIRARHGALDVIETRDYLLANSDLIYASTGPLAELFIERYPNQRIFHGIYAPYMGELRKSRIEDKSRAPIIGYMGSKGHQHDLDLVVPAIEQLLDERQELSFEVFGTIKMPTALERFGNRVRSHSVQKSYSEFLSSLADLGWDIGLAPLVDTKFNRCKAPTKFIEYTACGIPVLASDIPVYSNVIPNRGGALVSRDWYISISSFLDNPKLRMEALEIASKHCQRAFPKTLLEKQLLDVFNLVISPE